MLRELGVSPLIPALVKVLLALLELFSKLIRFETFVFLFEIIFRNVSGSEKHLVQFWILVCVSI